ncbi:PpiC-type peptidyl-prolyl cis-trans isomerase [Richelia sinica FACHB-800]|uniref:peptidylprolyl isomerase n=1 Tax=Richelia sinica FACHB-800 TaxID=1357546 RepID=A0A975T515_9NOST|nr:peptidylprolyl isomerase [Richelia sinica]MBD2664907.1 peptidylprolyl isomerase [Richelia sinica FACHB-800]QXE22341.1 PpiC-type peptidyl-prolyl cis-trans isomerase [Richelia sinica FACHB-800]
MSQAITITKEDIFQQVQFSCKIPEIVEQIVTRKVIMAAAEEAGIKIETDELQKAADKIRLSYQLNSADDTWKWLNKHSLSLDNFEEIVYTNLISSKLVSHLFADQVEPYFFENQLDYAGVVMYEVIINDEDLALELFYAIKEGEMSFFDVAHEYIEDKELRRKGGYLGTVSRRELKPEISAAVFTATPPQLIKPIITCSGVHIIFVEEIIQPQLNENIRTQILTQLFSIWLKEKTHCLAGLLTLNY